MASGSRQDYKIARQAVRILIQQQDLGDVGSCDATTKRDQFMAENVQWLLTRMNVGKLSLWAHNYHIANIPYATCNLPSMGTYLKRQLNDNYLIVGTSLTNGSFTVVDESQNNRGLTALSIRTEGIKSSFNYLLGKAQDASFALYLNQSPLDSTVSNWLGKNHPFFETGAGFNESKPEQYYNVTPLIGRYDLLIHFRDTTPT